MRRPAPSATAAAREVTASLPCLPIQLDPSLWPARQRCRREVLHGSGWPGQGRAGLQSESESEFSSERKAKRLGKSVLASGAWEQSVRHNWAASWSSKLRPLLQVTKLGIEGLGPSTGSYVTSRVQSLEVGAQMPFPLRLQGPLNLPDLSWGYQGGRSTPQSYPTI